MLRTWLVGFRICHDTSKVELEHQSLHTRHVDTVILPSQVVHHPAAYIEQIPGELLIDKFSFANKRDQTLSADPCSARLHRDIPDLFLSYSSSIRNRPISE